MLILDGFLINQINLRFSHNNYHRDYYEYDYWFFIEDDQIILKNKILSNAVDLMLSIDNKIGLTDWRNYISKNPLIGFIPSRKQLFIIKQFFFKQN